MIKSYIKPIDQSGWSWFIPLHNGTVSVGFVLTEEASRRKKKTHTKDQANDTDSNGSLKGHYLNQFQFTPGLAHLLRNAALESEVKSASDYSYSASAFSGDHFRIVGDAAGIPVHLQSYTAYADDDLSPSYQPLSTLSSRQAYISP